MESILLTAGSNVCKWANDLIRVELLGGLIKQRYRINHSMVGLNSRKSGN